MEIKMTDTATAANITTWLARTGFQLEPGSVAYYSRGNVRIEICDLEGHEIDVFAFEGVNTFGTLGWQASFVDAPLVAISRTVDAANRL